MFADAIGSQAISVFPYTHFFCPKNHSTLQPCTYLLVYKKDNAERFETQTFQQ